jgi:hypothetical protein
MADIGLNEFFIAMNEGFAKLHEKIDQRLKDIYEGNTLHRSSCESRFQKIENTLAVREAMRSRKEKGLLHKMALASAIAAATSVTGAAMAYLWLLFMAHINLVKP